MENYKYENTEKLDKPSTQRGSTTISVEGRNALIINNKKQGSNTPNSSVGIHFKNSKVGKVIGNKITGLKIQFYWKEIPTQTLFLPILLETNI